MPCLRPLIASAKSITPILTSRHAFSTAPTLRKALPPRPKPPPDSELEDSYLKGSGPGGQKINKTSSAVQLKHPLTGLVVKSQATRSLSQNRKHARELLAQKLDDLLHGAESRSAIVGEIKKKKTASAAKKKRRKYRKLENEAAAASEDAVEDIGDEKDRSSSYDVGSSSYTHDKLQDVVSTLDQGSSRQRKT